MVRFRLTPLPSSSTLTFVDISFIQALHRLHERRTALEAITRYHAYAPMWFRTTLWTHTQRVAAIARHVVPRINARVGRRWIDPDFTEAICQTHDDPEILTGDEQAGNKAIMTDAQRRELERREYAAIETLSQRYPRYLGPYNYKALLLASMREDLPENWVRQFADKLDGFGEALHELFAGNLRGFATPVTTRFGRIQLPSDFYIDYFASFAEKYPKLAFLTEGPDRMLDVRAPFNARDVARQGRFPNTFSIREPTWYQPYNLWRQILLDARGGEEVALLTHPRET